MDDLNLTPQEQRIVDYHRESIRTGRVGRDAEGRPITVFAIGPKVRSGPHAGKFASVPGWVDGRTLSEDEALERWQAEINEGNWPLYDSGDQLNRRAQQIHKIMDYDADLTNGMREAMFP